MKLLHFESIIDHVKWLFFVQRRGRGGAKGRLSGVMLKYFEIKKAFRYYIKQIDSMLPCVWFSNRSQKTSKCGKNISDTLGSASCATYLFLPHFDVICDLLPNRRTATWNLFVKYITRYFSSLSSFLRASEVLRTAHFVSNIACFKVADNEIRFYRFPPNWSSLSENKLHRV